MNLEDLIHAAATYMGMPEFRYHQSDTFEVALPDGLQLAVEPSQLEEAVHVYATVGALPAMDQGRLMETLLKAQLYHGEMGEGCCFGLDEDTQAIVLNRKLSLAGLDEERFVSALNEFASWATHWRDRLQSAPVEVVTDSYDSFSSSQLLRA